jgi:hypothetical protein
MKPTDALKPGMTVQLDPYAVRNQAFAGCFMIVDEPKAFGAQGYVQGLGPDRDTPGGRAYYRARWEEMEPIGEAVWIVP